MDSGPVCAMWHFQAGGVDELRMANYGYEGKRLAWMKTAEIPRLFGCRQAGELGAEWGTDMPLSLLF